MAFFEALRRAIRDYAEGVHQAGEPLGQGGERALEARLRRALPPSYAEFLRSFDGLMLFNEQLQLFGSADAGLCFLSDGSLRIGEGPEGALLLGADGAVRLCDEEQPDPIVAGTDLERFLDATLAREGLLVDREGEYRDVFDEEGALMPGARRRRIQAGRKKDPGASLYLLEEAELLLEDQQPEAALAALRQAVAGDPGAGAAWELLAALLREAGDTAGAREAALRAARAAGPGFLRASRLLDAAELSGPNQDDERAARVAEAWEADPMHAATLCADAEEVLAGGDRAEATRLAGRLRLLLGGGAAGKVDEALAQQAEALEKQLRVRAALQVV